MVSIGNKYRIIIEQSIQRQKVEVLPAQSHKLNKRPNLKIKNDKILPESFLFTLDHTTKCHNNQSHTPLIYNEWPYSCIGVILCEYYQNEKIFSVYGTGILISDCIVLTSAENIYCNRMYNNIKFITGLIGNKCSDIYHVKQIHYPKEYLSGKKKEYNFGILQLYADLSQKYGYIGWKMKQQKEVKNTHLYCYRKNMQGSLELQRIINHKSEDDQLSTSCIMINQSNGDFNLIGLYKKSQIYLNKEIKDLVNNWILDTKMDLSGYSNHKSDFYMQLAKYRIPDLNKINLQNDNLGPNGCKSLKEANWPVLNTLNLMGNNILAEGCQYLRQANWKHITVINLLNNNIGDLGCYHLSKQNWKYLNTLNLVYNNISSEGCKSLKQAKWTYLTTINLGHNKIDAEGCRYLSQTNWIYLTFINLGNNNINAEGCKYLTQVNWSLTTIYLNQNDINAEGCKYLSQANWEELISIYLSYGNIQTEGCRYLRETQWNVLKSIDIRNNNINNEGYKYLKDTNWTQLEKLYIGSNNIMLYPVCRMGLKQLWQGLFF